MNQINNPFMPQMQSNPVQSAQPSTPIQPSIPFQPNAPIQNSVPNAPVQSGAPNGFFEVDLTNADNAGMVPEGNYRVRCIDVTQETSKQGNPMFVWTFIIVDGEYAGKEFKYFTAMTPAAIWKVSEAVISLGIGASGQIVRFSRSDVINKECGAEIIDDDYNGNKKSIITRLMPLNQLYGA